MDRKIPEKNLYIIYDNLFKASEKLGLPLSTDSAHVTKFYKKFNEHLKEKRFLPWDRNTIRDLAHRKKQKMRSQNSADIADFLQVEWYDIFSTNAHFLNCEKDQNSPIPIEEFKTEIVSVISDYERKIIKLEYQIKDKNQESQTIQDDLKYNKDQLKNAKLKYHNLEDEHKKLIALIEHIKIKINTLDNSNKYKNEAEIAIKEYKFELAESLLLKARKIELEIANQKLRDAAESSIVLGELREQQFDYRNALAYYLEANSILANQHLYIEKIAYTYLYLADYKAALSYFKEYQKLVMETNQSEELNAKAYFNIGIAFDRQGKYKNALENFEICLASRLSIMESENIDIAKTYHIIGNMQMRLGKFKKSLENYNKALELKYNLLENDDMLIGTTQMSIGVVYLYQNKIDLAEKKLINSLNIFQNGLNSINLNSALANMNLIVISNKKNNFSSSIEYANTAIDIFTKIYDNKHDHIGRCYNNLAEAYYGNKEYEKSIQFYQKSLEIKTEAFGKYHDTIASSYLGIGRSYKEIGANSLAFKYFKLSHEIYIKTLGENNYYTEQAYSYLNKFTKNITNPENTL